MAPDFFPKVFLIYAFFSRGDFFVALLLAFLNVLNFVLYARILRFLAFYTEPLIAYWKPGFPLGRSFSFLTMLCIIFSIFFSVIFPLFFWGFVFSLV